jgi:hypothetical protein
MELLHDDTTAAIRAWIDHSTRELPAGFRRDIHAWLRGISLDRIRRDRILHEALATGADPLHLTLMFNIDHTNAMAYANAARNLLTSPAEQPTTPGGVRLAS